MFTYCLCSICTQTCNDGYALDDGSRTSSLTCDTYGGWKNGMEFQMCRGSSGIIQYMATCLECLFIFLIIPLNLLTFIHSLFYLFDDSIDILRLQHIFVHGWITIFI